MKPSRVTPERWRYLITHVQEKVEDYYWKANGLQSILVDEFIISLEGDSDSESEVSSSSDSD